MIKKLSLIAGAVAAAMVVAPAMALPVSGAGAVVETTPGVVKLVVSGSSAFQTAFETELSGAASSICQNGTYTRYVGTVGSGTAPNNFAAYSCTSQAALFGGVAKPTIIYYRSEGGSAYGLAPTVRTAAKVYRLALNGTDCVQTTSTAGTCAIGASYNATTDVITTATTAVIDSNTDLGLADEEATMFVDANYPTAPKVQPALSVAEVATLNTNSSPLVLQSFGVFVNAASGSPLATLPSLSKEVIADVFRGKWSDWSQVPKNDGTNAVVAPGGLPIVVCRREAGSGTQVAAAVFFHNTNCGGADEFVRSAAGFSGNLDPTTQVLTQTSTGNMRTCLSTPGAIGYISAEADAAGARRMIKIDQQSTSPGAINNNLGIATASGDYGFAFELTAFKRATLSGDSLTLANKLITVSQDQTTGPTSGNVSFLPTGNNAGNTVFPLTTPPGKQPVSCFTRSGNSCSTLADAC